MGTDRKGAFEKPGFTQQVKPEESVFIRVHRYSQFLARGRSQILGDDPADRCECHRIQHRVRERLGVFVSLALSCVPW